MGLPIIQADTKVDERTANDTSAVSRADWVNDTSKDRRPAHVSEQMPVSKRPIMLARDAEGAGDDHCDLLDIASFLRDTAPAKDLKRGSWHTGKNVHNSQGKLVKRMFKVGSRRSIRASCTESSKNDQTKHAININYTERISKGGKLLTTNTYVLGSDLSLIGRKYIHITPLGASSLGSEACEVEANQERPVSLRLTANALTRPVTALPLIDHLKSRSPTAAASPKATLAAPRTSDGSEINSFVSDLQDEMQRRWQTPLRVKKSSDSRGAQPSPTNGSMNYPPSPEDRDVSAILRATGSPLRRALTAAVLEASMAAGDSHAPHTPSQGLRSHPAKPPSPPPRKPLPEVPGGYQNHVSKAPLHVETDQETRQSCTSDRCEADIHPLFRSTPDRLTPRGNAFRSASGTPTSTASNSPHIPQHDTASKLDAKQDYPIAAPILNGQWKQDMQSSGTLLASTISVNAEAAKSTRATNPVTMQMDESQPTTPTPTPQKREDRTRARKLRHLQLAKQSKDTKVKQLPTPDPSPTTSGQSDSRPSTATSTVPTLTSDTTTGCPMSPVVSVVEQSPNALRTNSTPLQKQRIHQKPAPLSFSSQLSKRLSDLAEPSPPFPYDDSSYTYTCDSGPVTMQELRELLPAIRLPPVNASQKHLSNGTDATELATDHFPLPHQRLSFASLQSQQCAAHAHKPDQPSRDEGEMPQSATSSTFAGLGSMHTPSRESFDTRLGYLERKNKLLEAALVAVLRTNGRMNGCVTCAEKRLSALSTASRSQRYSLFPTDSLKSKDRTQAHDTVARSASQDTLKSQKSQKSGVSQQDSRNSSSTQSNIGIGALELYKATRLDISSFSFGMQIAAGTGSGNVNGGTSMEGCS